ncbi:MAG: hypothetical protein K9L17_14385 [Clostridiales bacterium]|nr:hypothetical protein [Clostridiales bacterium]
MFKGWKSKWFLLVLGLIFLCGCSYKSGTEYVQKKPLEFNSYYDIVKKPEVNKIAECYVGQSMIEMSQAYFIPEVKIDIKTEDVITCTGKSTIATNSTINNFFNKKDVYIKITIPDSKLTLDGYNENGTFYKSSKNMTICNYTEGEECQTPYEMEGGIYIPHNSSQPTMAYWGPDFNKKSKAKTYDVTLKECPNIRYTVLDPITITKKFLPEYADKKPFKREILYLGKSGETINLSYREFKDDFARASFSKRVTYDLSESNIIGYQEARFKVLEATNTKIRYKVLEHLPYYPQEKIPKEIEK